MGIKSDTEYIFKTGSVIDSDGNISIERKQELVRCEDCEYSHLWTNDGTGKRGKCAFLIGDNQYVPADGFCYLGERMKP